MKDIALEKEFRLARLRPPAGVVDVVLDTDTDNEMDDQFALALALLSPEKLKIRAVTAAPFHNNRSIGPRDGMEKSYGEILRWLELFDADAALAVPGSPAYLPDRDTPVDSPAARKIIESAHDAAARGTVLYVLAIATLTNVSSALLLDPSIRGHLVVVWLGGHARSWPGNREFNLIQDVPAAQVLLDSGTPLIRIPCVPCCESLCITLPEIRQHCAPFGKVGAALFELTSRFVTPVHSRVIWDISTTGFLVRPEAFTTEIIPTPALSDDAAWQMDPARPVCCEVTRIRRDPIFDMLYQKVAERAGYCQMVH